MPVRISTSHGPVTAIVTRDGDESRSRSVADPGTAGADRTEFLCASEDFKFVSESYLSSQ